MAAADGPTIHVFDDKPNSGTTAAAHEQIDISNGLVASGRGRITARQIEAARRAMTRYIKRGGNIWIRIFPDKPITKKPLEVRMGKGKGNVEYWVALVQPGKVMFEMAGVEEEQAREAFRLASAKLPVKTHFIK